MSNVKSPELEFVDENCKKPRWKGETWGWWVVAWVIFFLSLVGFGYIIPGIKNETVGISLTCATAVTILLTFLCLVLVERIDPGVIPQNEVKDSVIALAEFGFAPPNLHQDERGQWVRTRLTKTGEVQTVERYCITCNIWRQPRTSHCGKCGYCMERFDHHCNAIGTCIAKKNHRFFIGLLVFGSISSVLLMVACILKLKQKNGTLRNIKWKDEETLAIAVFAFIYMYLGFVFLFGLFHCAILFCDITTKQYLKKTDVGKIEQAKATWLHHFYGICCSEVRSKFTVEEDYSKKKGSRDAVGQLPIRRREEDTV